MTRFYKENWRVSKWLIVKDAENIVQTTIHIAEIAIIYLDNRMVWQQQEGISAKCAEQLYTEDTITV